MSKFVNFMVGVIIGAGAGVAGSIYLAIKKKTEKCCSCDETADCKCKCHDKIEEMFDENGDPIVVDDQTVEVQEPVEEVVIEEAIGEDKPTHRRRFVIRRKKASHRKFN